MKPIFAIDPGNTQSGYIVYYPDTHTVGDFGKISNQALREVLARATSHDEYDYAIEMIASYGMAVGQTVFDTCVWVGRFTELIRRKGFPVQLVYRKEVKMYLCGSTRAKDSNIRQAISDRFPQTGGGATPVKGTKANPGPLYGLSADVWAALGVALTHSANQQRKVAA